MLSARTKPARPPYVRPLQLQRVHSHRYGALCCKCFGTLRALPAILVLSILSIVLQRCVSHPAPTCVFRPAVVLHR